MLTPVPQSMVPQPTWVNITSFASANFRAAVLATDSMEPPAYAKSFDGFVIMRGAIMWTAGALPGPQNMFNLPVGYRPAGNPGGTIGVYPGRLGVAAVGWQCWSSGDVRIGVDFYTFSAGSHTGTNDSGSAIFGSSWISLDGVRFWVGP